MAKKKNKEINVPESVCLFDKKEIDYIKLTSKSIPYRVDIQTATINVPHDHFDIANDNLHIRHLINKFAFVVQATIGAELLQDNSFNPELRSVKKQELIEVELPKKTEVWLNKSKKERIYIKSIDDKNFVFTYLGSMQGDRKVLKSDVIALVSSGQLSKE